MLHEVLVETGRHVMLVGVSVGLATAIGVPLGSKHAPFKIAHAPRKAPDEETTGMTSLSKFPPNGPVGLGKLAHLAAVLVSKQVR